MMGRITEVFSPEAFVECEDDQGCGGDGGDGCRGSAKLVGGGV